MPKTGDGPRNKSKAKQKKSRGAPGRLRIVPSSPAPAEAILAAATWINRVPAGERDVDVYRHGDGLLAHRPGVAGADGLPEIPEVMVPFLGYLVPMGITIRETNGLVLPDAPSVRGHGDPLAQGRVVGLCRWQVTMCGEVAYGGSAQSARQGAMLAVGAMERLIAQMERWGIRWWDPENWRGRRVWYQGVAAVLLDVDPMNGQMFVAPEMVDGEPYMDFPEIPAEAESGQELPRQYGGLWVDMLDPSVGWVRLATPTGAIGRDAAGTQSDAVLVSSGGDPPEGAAPTSHPDATDTETPPGPSPVGVDAAPSDGLDARPEVDDDQRERPDS